MKRWQLFIELLDTPRLQPQRTPQQCLNVAAAFAKTDRLEDAARILRDGLNTAPDSMPLADALASVLKQLGRKEEAAVVLEVARARKLNDSQTGVR